MKPCCKMMGMVGTIESPNEDHPYWAYVERWYDPKTNSHDVNYIKIKTCPFCKTDIDYHETYWITRDEYDQRVVVMADSWIPENSQRYVKIKLVELTPSEIEQFNF